MYSAYEITDESREELLERFPPKYIEVICHHITVEFPGSVLPPVAESAHVVGYQDSEDGLEAFVAEINGSTRRSDGRLYHITFSLDRSKGKKPVHSNDLLARHFTEIPPLKIEVRPALLD